MRTGLMVALALSLAANVFLGGFVAGRFIGHGPRFDGGHPDHGPMMFGDLDRLSPDERDAFRAVFKGKHDEMRANFREAMRLRKAFENALSADPWDRAQTEKALSDLRAVESKQQTEIGELIIDAFEKLPAKDRKALVAAGDGNSMGRRRMMIMHRRRHGSPDDDAQGDNGDMPPPDDDSGDAPPPGE